MFSKRLFWEAHPNRLALLLEQKRRSGARVLDLTESNPTRAGLEYPADEILAALRDPGSLIYEPSPAGSREARAAVTDYYAARGLTIDPSRIVLTASTSEAYAYLFKLLADPGDEVLVPRPSYPLFEYLAALESVRARQYPLVYHGGWSIDMDALRRAVNERTRAVVLVNPNNPTGSYIKKSELAELAGLGPALISDEVFADFSFGLDPRRVPSLAGVEETLTFCLSGLSKIAGLPQMKLGWIVAGGPAASQALERLDLIADTYLSVGTPAQHAAPHWLAIAGRMQEQIRGRLHENLESLRAAIGHDSPGRVLDVEGGWYAIVQAPRTRSEEDWALELLRRDDVLVQPGFFYDFESEAYLVLSLLTPGEVFREGVQRLKGQLNEA